MDLSALTGWIPSISVLIGLALSGWGLYRKIMNVLKQQQEALEAFAEATEVIQKAYADKKIDNDEIPKIKKAIERAKREGKDVIEAWREVVDQTERLIKKANKARRR